MFKSLSVPPADMFWTQWDAYVQIKEIVPGFAFFSR